MLEGLLMEKGRISEVFPILNNVRNDQQMEEKLRIGAVKEKALAILIDEGIKPFVKKRSIPKLRKLFAEEERKYFDNVLNTLIGDDIVYAQQGHVYNTDSLHGKFSRASEDYLYAISGLI